MAHFAILHQGGEAGSLVSVWTEDMGGSFPPPTWSTSNKYDLPLYCRSFFYGWEGLTASQCGARPRGGKRTRGAIYWS